MLDKLDQVKNLYAFKRKTAEMKKQIAKIVVVVTEGDYEVSMRGDQTVESIKENGESRDDLKKLFNKAIKESQKMVAKKMRGQFGDLGIPGL